MERRGDDLDLKATILKRFRLVDSNLLNFQIILLPFKSHPSPVLLYIFPTRELLCLAILFISSRQVCSRRALIFKLKFRFVLYSASCCVTRYFSFSPCFRLCYGLLNRSSGFTQTTSAAKLSKE